MATNMVESRVHRILKRNKHYRAAGPDDADRLGLTPILEPGERLLGMYTNPPGWNCDEIAVTTKRLLLHQPGKEPRNFKYRDVQDISLGEAQKASRSLTVTLYDGTMCVVDVALGEGKFRDSLEFLRFLKRVVDDVQMGRVIKSVRKD
jgi:hypothetical protein